ncbi:hypothetical protein THASP1DRAFT_29729 [Thamnocephalis sphaerospora]|uniref:Rad4 transglutaminase-like domain-containing protein n=1 Tax=Thamnocephalis sphaerospora TaxID=78915 RepID=A0A4P9XQY8_9FUNG|nr:hypothetical protein THASP1DRAFT_29729 [Thamnocephalis sphaerospora]|eukprot:RKP08465.1 hypothetical protein THASP1DRAFT_29729 [Thamnocephalis sphaerospora]
MYYITLIEFLDDTASGPSESTTVDTRLPQDTIEITFSNMPVMKERVRGTTKYDREAALAAHRAHLLCWLAYWRYRHGHISSPLVQASSLSLVPLELSDSYRRALAESQRDANLKRKRAADDDWFVHWLQHMVEWWRARFQHVIVDGSTDWTDHAAPETAAATHGLNKTNSNRGRMEECTRLLNCLQQNMVALADSTLLFVALLRMLGVRTRFVVSLQPMSFSVAATKKILAATEMQTASDRSQKGQVESKPTKRRKTNKSQNATSTKANQPQMAWCEVLHPTEGHWVAVDLARGLVNEPTRMEEHGPLPYVTAFDIGRRIKDVSRRYASQWAAKTLRLRPPMGKAGRDWWLDTLAIYAERDPSEVDVREDAELLSHELSEKMPTTVSEFNNHPLYALERHLKKFEILSPREPVIGHIRGEPIYPRSCVKQLHTAEAWLKEGRQIKKGEMPVKEVKSRAVTLLSRREQVMAQMEGYEKLSGLYGYWQTEPYAAPPVVSGKIPKNGYGNIDLFQPEMLPPGGVHLPQRGIAKIARKLDIDYAEAVTGFDFQSRHCIPVVTGIVVAAENEALVLDAWRAHEHARFEKERSKREKAALKRWRTLLHGISIRDRLQKQYGEKIDDMSVAMDDSGDEDNGSGSTPKSRSLTGKMYATNPPICDNSSDLSTQIQLALVVDL